MRMDIESIDKNKNKMKRLCNKFALAVMFLAFAITSASAYDFEAGGLYYNIISTYELTASVSGLADSSIVDLKIPSTVTYKSRTLKVTAIGESAFRNCKVLKSVKFAEGISSLDKNSFTNCSELQEVDLPSTLTGIAEGTFSKCEKLRRCDLRYVENIGSEAFVETGLEEVNLPKCSELGSKTLMNMPNLREVAIQSELKSIPESCFKGCSNLQEISLPDSILEIGDGAFCDCESLRELQLPPNLEYFGGYVIDGDLLLKKLVIPDSVKEMGSGRYDCLKSITYGTGLDKLHDYYGYYYNGFKNLEEVIIKDSEKTFSMRSYWSYPPFSKSDIKHYYVGRPLYETNWYYNSPRDTKAYSCKQGETGHIGLLEIAGGCTEVPYFYQRIDTLVLGEDVSRFEADNIYTDSLKVLFCKSIAPPYLKTESYDSRDIYISNQTYVNLPVYVPKGSLAAYQSAKGWKNFWDIREYDETTGISAVKTRPQETGHNYYDLQGCKLREPQKGINIIDGKKVLVK